MMIDIQKAYEKAKDEMQPQSFEFEIPKEVKEQAEEMFGIKAKDDATRWSNFVFILLQTNQMKNKI